MLKGIGTLLVFLSSIGMAVAAVITFCKDEPVVGSIFLVIAWQAIIVLQLNKIESNTDKENQ